MTRDGWPEWLSPEYTAIHTAVFNEMVDALEHCYDSADAAGQNYTTEGLFSISANNVIGLLRSWGFEPPMVAGPVERKPLPYNRVDAEYEDTVWCTACSGDGFHQVECERCEGSGEEPLDDSD